MKRRLGRHKNDAQINFYCFIRTALPSERGQTLGFTQDVCSFTHVIGKTCISWVGTLLLFTHYQVLGKDVLKSSLLDDIDLYLECDDDSLYVMPTVPSFIGNFLLCFSLHLNDKKSDRQMHHVVIDRKAREIMYLVPSVSPSVRLSVNDPTPEPFDLRP